MKYIKAFGSIILLAVSTILLVNCKKDDPAPLTNQQQAAKKISVTWGSAEVIDSPVAGAERTLESLTLTFSVNGKYQPAGFSASGAPDFFTSSPNSSWSWASANSVTTVNLSNVAPVQTFAIEALTEANLTISFHFDGPVIGRVEGIGEYRVRLTRQ